MAPGVTLVCVPQSPGALVESLVPPFIVVLDPTAPMPVAIRGSGVVSIFLHCGPTKSTLVPCSLSATNLSCAIEFLKSASSLDYMAQELSA